MKHSPAVLLDTSFFLRFLNDADPLFGHADAYYRYFLEQDIAMLLSTISVAEFCVRGALHDLPIQSLQILPFTLQHGVCAGHFAHIAFTHRRQLALPQRTIIPADTKLFAQAHTEAAIEYYLSSDSESSKIYELLKRETRVNFQFLNLNRPHTEAFSILF